MELDIPGEGEGDPMDLPPMEEPERATAEPTPSTPPQASTVVESSRSDVPPEKGTVPPPSTGMAPFLLEGADRGGEKSRAATAPAETYDAAVPVEELATELKAVPPPSSRAETLKVPPDTEPEASGELAVPEIPLLKAEERAQGMSVSSDQDPSLIMKPLSDLYSSEAVSRSSAPSRPSRRPEDYLQVREDIDARLIKIYERFYKSR
jgi:hypothetical protein